MRACVCVFGLEFLDRTIRVSSIQSNLRNIALIDGRQVKYSATIYKKRTCLLNTVGQANQLTGPASLKTVALAKSLTGLAQQRRQAACCGGEEDVHHVASYADATRRAPRGKLRRRNHARRAAGASPHTQGGNASLFDGGKSGVHRRADSRCSAARSPSSH
jgi:hypothetical protein